MSVEDVWHRGQLSQHSSNSLFYTVADTNSSKPQLGVKRRREQPSRDDNILNPILIHPYPPSHFDQPETAWPQLLLRRAQLPLYLLDPHQPSTATYRSRLVSADVQDLDPNEKERNWAGPELLIVKTERDGALCALERVDKGIFSICRLIKSVNVESLRRLGSPSVQSLAFKAPRRCSTATKPWWADAALQGRANEVTGKISSSHGVVGEPALGSEPMTGTEIDLPQLEAVDSPARLDLGNGGLGHGSLEAANLVQSSEEAYSNIVTQYLETLYASKTSLAYFAKGPLSRARATCAQTSCSSQDRPLADFLRRQILEVSTLEKKHKATLPAIIRTQLADPVENPKTSKRRNIRRLKPGKDGLWTGEIEMIAKWWMSEESPHALALDVAASHAKTKFLFLRCREHMLQLVLVLETMALEATATAAEASAMAIQAPVAEDAQEDGRIQPAVKRKAKKAVHLHKFLDAIIDRLTIWQSVESFESSGDDPSHSNEAVMQDDVSAIANSLGKQTDQLKDFCTQVVLPFYSSRLPEVVKQLAKRFGVATGRFPDRDREAKPMRKPSGPRPSNDLKRAATDGARKSMQRTATMNSISQQVRAPSLTRSATDPMILGAGRDRSTTPLAHAGDARRSLSRSSSINLSRSLNQREVDFGALAKFRDTKNRQKVDFEQELQEAISTLKKPNRTLAVKDYVDAVDTRKTSSIGYSTGKPLRRLSMLGTCELIKATPKRRVKTKDIVTMTPSHIKRGSPPHNEFMIRSSFPIIPSSTIRPFSQRYSQPDQGWLVMNTPAKSQIRYEQGVASFTGCVLPEYDQEVISTPSVRRVSDLPFKVPALKVANILHEVPERPNVTTALAVFETPAKRKLSQALDMPEMPPLSICQKPVKVDFQAITNASVPCQQEDNSIYASLGWEDDSYD